MSSRNRWNAQAATQSVYVSAFVLVVATGCSAGNGTGTLGQRGSGTGNSSAGQTAEGGSASSFGGAPAQGGNSQMLFSGGTSSGGSSQALTPDAGCATTSQAAEQITIETPVEITTVSPVALFIMMDRSGSMVTGFPAPASPDSWNNATAAVTAFVNDPTSAGIDIGLGTFPFGPNNTASCDGADCGQAVVPIAPLPDNAQAMIDGMQQQIPNSPVTLTPTECGLNGMINQCVNYMANSPTGEQCVAILVTDGTPTQCDTTVDQGSYINLVNIATQGYSKGVLTFTLGLPGADLNFLDEVARAGGTDASLDVTQGPQAFIESLNAIRDTVTTTEIHTEIQSTQLDCSWIVPPPPEGETFDENMVNVEFEAEGIPRQAFGFVPSKDECASRQGGWYYEPTASGGKSISVCDDTCTIIKNSFAARVDIILGCATIESPLR